MTFSATQGHQKWLC